jgi:predicted RNA-binding Zn-ribbon protein involved in translation (DUF1610 family)
MRTATAPAPVTVCPRCGADRDAYPATQVPLPRIGGKTVREAVMVCPACGLAKIEARG